LEAMSHALPVVSTRHAGIPEAVLDGITGLLCNEGDTMKMAENIRYLVDHDSQSIQMGVDGWMRAKQYFSWQHERASLLKILGLDS
jgi:glycosyltransferase involved in cell wall biosynthesis